MRTDHFGTEVAPVPRDRSRLIANIKIFVIGIALGAGLCVGLGPPLPVVDMLLTGAAAPDDATATAAPPRWVVALFDPSVTGASTLEHEEAVAALHQRWLVLLDTLHDMRADEVGVTR